MKHRCHLANPGICAAILQNKAILLVLAIIVAVLVSSHFIKSSNQIALSSRNEQAANLDAFEPLSHVNEDSAVGLISDSANNDQSMPISRDFTVLSNRLRNWKSGSEDFDHVLDLAIQQKPAMRQLMGQNPEFVFKHAIEEDVWEKLPEELKHHVAHRFSGSGHYEYTHDCETEASWHHLTMEKFSTGNAILASGLTDKKSFQGEIKGVVLDDAVAVVAMGDGTPPVEGSISNSEVMPDSVTGIYSVLWLNVKFSDESAYPSAGSSLSAAADAFHEYSYGRLNLAYDELDVSIAATKASNPSGSTVRTQANAAALALGYNTSSYKAVAYRQSIHGQYATLSNPGYMMLSKSSKETNIHEIAHTMGVAHANLWSVNSGQPAWGEGVNVRYGEIWDAMSYINPRGDFNVPEKVQLGWLDEDTDYIHDVGSGVYRIYDYRSNDRSEFSTAGVDGAYLAVSVFKDTAEQNGEYGDRRYMLSYRDFIKLGGIRIAEGLYLHWPRWIQHSNGSTGNAAYGSTIVDTHPQINEVNDAPLGVGETFIDNDPGNRDGDIYITVLAKADPDGIPQSGDEYLDVKVVVGDQVGNHAPTGTLNLAKSMVAPGEPLEMSVTASDADGDTLAYHWDFGHGDTVDASNVMATDGSATQSFTYEAGGNYVITVTISDGRGGSTVLSESVLVSRDGTVNMGQLGILDVTANFGINPATGNHWQAGDKYRLMFVASGIAGNAGTTVDTYNAHVKADAAGSTTYPNLGSVNWYAVMSDASTNARDNTGTNPSSKGVAVLQLNSTVIASDNADLWHSYTTTLANLDRNAVPATLPGSKVWTGSNSDGTRHATDYLGTGGALRWGHVSKNGGSWISNGSDANLTNQYGVRAISEELTIVTSVVGDVIPPDVASLAPINGSSQIAVGNNLVVAFDENITAGSGVVRIKNLTDSTESTIDINDGSQINISGATLTINPSSDLIRAKHYAVQIDGTAIEDISGNAFVGIVDDTTWSFSTMPPNFAEWISAYDVGTLTNPEDDYDGDGIANILENYFGTNPAVANKGLSPMAVNMRGGKTFTFSHPINDFPVAGLSVNYIWSKDLVSFHSDGETANGTTVNFDRPNAVNGMLTVTASIQGDDARIFVNVAVTLDQ